jgi:hypothetical protein
MPVGRLGIERTALYYSTEKRHEGYTQNPLARRLPFAYTSVYTPTPQT